MPQSTLLMIALILAIAVASVVALLLEALILRAACYLASVDPPSYLKAILLILINGAVAGPAGYGIGLVVGLLGVSSRVPAEGILLTAGVLGLVVGAIIATVIYTVALRVRIHKGLLVWFFETCVRTLVVAVFGLFAIGVWTIVDGIRRVI
ncbi:MAG TPA: hypothetical protein VKS79_10880 [Gemmataceae bacterium]|nr:hypothetical protein [Gemmataceae bacterium]